MLITKKYRKTKENQNNDIKRSIDVKDQKEENKRKSRTII